MAEDPAPPFKLEQSKLEAVAQEMRGANGVIIKDRQIWFTRHAKCFVGSAAVDWMVEKGHAASREDAVSVGNQMIESDIIHHVSDEKSFQDDNVWYRYREDESNYDGMSYMGQKKNCSKAGLLSYKKGGLGSGWADRFVVITEGDQPRWLHYESEHASKPSKIIDLKQVGLDVAECEDCKKDFHCFTISGRAAGIHDTYCTSQSKDQQSWLDALVNAGVNLQLPDLHNTANSLFEFNAVRHDGTLVEFGQYAGKVVLVVNVASY